MGVLDLVERNRELCPEDLPFSEEEEEFNEFPSSLDCNFRSYRVVILLM